LKDFRTLLASAQVLEALAKIQPATSERQRRKQIKGAVGAAADHLANTPAICRRSYVHDAVVEAFEDGTLAGFSSELNGKSSIRSAQALAEVVAKERVPSKNDDLMSALQQSAKQS
jgi:DNA topoisomerase-1